MKKNENPGKKSGKKWLLPENFFSRFLCSIVLAIFYSFILVVAAATAAAAVVVVVVVVVEISGTGNGDQKTMENIGKSRANCSRSIGNHRECQNRLGNA